MTAGERPGPKYDLRRAATMATEANARGRRPSRGFHRDRLRLAALRAQITRLEYQLGDERAPRR